MIGSRIGTRQERKDVSWVSNPKHNVKRTTRETFKMCNGNVMIQITVASFGKYEVV
jgi:hypothetical protein